jgi:hypothetical protein
MINLGLPVTLLRQSDVEERDYRAKRAKRSGDSDGRCGLKGGGG